MMTVPGEFRVATVVQLLSAGPYYLCSRMQSLDNYSKFCIVDNRESVPPDTWIKKEELPSKVKAMLAQKLEQTMLITFN